MSDLQAGLYQVAFEAHSRAETEEGRTADIDEAELRNWLAPYLGGSWDKAGEFVNYIRERAGLLVRHKTTAYTFPHRTFQEFLAACYLVVKSEDYPRQAAGLVKDDLSRWREVFVLAAGHAARTHRLGQAIGAVNALCPRDVKRMATPGADAFRQAVLAGEALLEIGLIGVRREDAGQAVLERIRDWLVAALRAERLWKPQERSGAGAILAKLGDPRPDVLAPEAILFCHVPAGPFRMGTREADIPLLKEQFGEYEGYEYEWEAPQHPVTLPAYYIARYPVTQAQYRAFIEAGGYQERPYWREAEAVGRWRDGKLKVFQLRWEGGEWQGEEAEASAPQDFGETFSLPNHPVVGVSWYEALAFTRWLTQTWYEAELLPADWTARLPTEAEWEKGARGGLRIPTAPVVTRVRAGLDQATADNSNPHPERLFPWGDAPDPNRANYYETGVGSTSAVGCFPGGGSPYGVEELSGNVGEWTSSLWGSLTGSEVELQFGYPYDMGDGRENLDADDNTLRVLRGGAFYDIDRGVRCASRVRIFPDYRNFNVGFRVVVSPISRPSGLWSSALGPSG